MRGAPQECKDSVVAGSGPQPRAMAVSREPAHLNVLSCVSFQNKFTLFYSVKGRAKVSVIPLVFYCLSEVSDSSNGGLLYLKSGH